MAALTFTVPNAALALLDAWAQQHGFTDFRAFEIDHIKNCARRARREQSEQQAADLVNQQPPDVTVT